MRKNEGFATAGPFLLENLICSVGTRALALVQALKHSACKMNLLACATQA